MPEKIKIDTKERIFQEAAELFSRDGFYKVSVREICDAAGVTKPVLYYYFGDKENLIYEMMKNTRELIEQKIFEYVITKEKFTDQLDGVIKFYLDLVDNYPHRLKFTAFIQFMSIPERVKEFKYNAAKNDWKVAADLFKKAQESGELKSDFNAEILARNYIGSIIVLLTEYIMEHLTRDEFESQLQTLLHFWKKQFVNENN